MKKLLLWAALLLCLALIRSTGEAQEEGKTRDSYWYLHGLCHADPDCINFYSELPAARIVLQYIQETYVDEVDFDKLLKIFRHNGLKGVFGMLDPHSVYVTKEEDLERSALDKPFGGIGAVLTKIGENVAIEEVLEGFPAQEAGLKEEDVIVSVDGKPLISKTAEEARDLIRGEVGKAVVLEIKSGDESIREVKILRREIKFESLTTKVYGENFCYARLRNFMAEADVVKLGSFLNEANCIGAVLDLRDNPGGRLDLSNAVSALFLENGKLIVSEVWRKETRRHFTSMYRLDKFSIVRLPLVILVNETSASASEIVAAALQDQGRAVVVGLPTFGKAVVQSSFEHDVVLRTMLGGDYFKLTVGRLLRPSGRSLQGKGVWPDFIITKRDGEDLGKILKGEKSSIAERMLPRHLEGPEEGKLTPEEADKVKLLKRDRQLQFALEILKAVHLMATP